MMKSAHVDRYTRASSDGRIIQCPCGAMELVYNFSWSALECLSCNAEIQKGEYTINATTRKLDSIIRYLRKGQFRLNNRKVFHV